MSLMTERLAQHLRLPRCQGNFVINGVGETNVQPKGIVNFQVLHVQDGGKSFDVEAFVLPKVTAQLPSIPVPPVTDWKHLMGLELADPEYETPAQIDLLLGGKVFSKVMLHSRRFGPSGTPPAF